MNPEACHVEYKRGNPCTTNLGDCLFSHPEVEGVMALYQAKDVSELLYETIN